MMLKFIENIGHITLNALTSVYEILAFSLICIGHMFSPGSYNPAMRMVLIKQIYFTTIGAFPIVIITATIFGSIIIGVVITLANEFNLLEQMGKIIITFVFDEFSPFVTALIVTLRSASAVNTEISLMKVNKELNFLKQYKIDLIDYLFLPRIIAGMLSVISLSILFSIIMISSGYLYVLFYINMDINNYLLLLMNALEIKDFLIALIKSGILGFIMMLIQINSGQHTGDSYASIPISVSKGLVQLFIAIFFIEVISLILQLI
ncbi:MAG: ABC transporter permease [Gammaproteobacteria bacterium]|nr:ABC transporter permease [Gammaproteobacteria bacterium]